MIHVKQPATVALHLDQKKLPREVYGLLTRHLQPTKDDEARREEAINNFGKAGRDPAGIGDIMGSLVEDKGWAQQLANVRINNQWAQIVGDYIADHTEEVHYEHGIVTIYTSSTIWQSHFVYMAEQIKEKLREALPPGTFEDVRVLGPQRFTGRGGYISRRRNQHFR